MIRFRRPLRCLWDFFRKELAEVLIPQKKIKDRVATLGAAISEDYAGKDLVIVCVLSGAFMFLADLVRHIYVHHEIYFMAASSYGDSTKSSGVVRLLLDLEANIEGRDVLIVEDIVDTGRTLDYIIRILKARNPASLRVCVLLDKRERREVDVPLGYVGFEIADRFVIGYGLDLAERYRNLPFVAVSKEESSD